MFKNKTAVFLLVFFMILGISFLGYYYKVMREHPKKLSTYGNPGHTVKPFSFISQDGKVVTDKDFDGKIYVVEYFFTTCEGICPKMNENMAKVYQAFRGQNDVAILSHTVDPETDTVEQLKRYSMKFDADPNQWVFVTGNKDSLYKMAIKSYIVPVTEDTTNTDVLPDFIHTEKFILVDKEKHIRGIYDGTNEGDVKKLIVDINTLQSEYNDASH